MAAATLSGVRFPTCVPTRGRRYCSPDPSRAPCSQQTNTWCPYRALGTAREQLRKQRAGQWALLATPCWTMRKSVATVFCTGGGEATPARTSFVSCICTTRHQGPASISSVASPRSVVAFVTDTPSLHAGVTVGAIGMRATTTYSHREYLPVSGASQVRLRMCERHWLVRACHNSKIQQSADARAGALSTNNKKKHCSGATLGSNYNDLGAAILACWQNSGSCQGIYDNNGDLKPPVRCPCTPLNKQSPWCLCVTDCSFRRPSAVYNVQQEYLVDI